jgi:hypothetical protein
MRRRTTTLAGVVLAAGLSLGFSGTASAADLDCKDFPSQAAAQADLVAHPSDPNGLDADHDGQACENYVYAAASNGASTGSSQVSTRPLGAVAAGDGSASDEGSSLPYVLGGVALTGAAGAAFAARRSARARA